MAAERMPGIQHIIAIGSGKGGVGKSTVSVNLALALQHRGARVGLVDADVLGPSIPSMLGIPYGQQPDTIAGKLLPVERHGIKAVSMGMLTDHDVPAILRGPMVTKYMRLFVEGVVWGQLDYLLIDLPPGTGDIQLTLAQSIPLSGAIIVTTPQDVSLNIARRGLRMFEKVQVPILGLVENMAGFACPSCGHTTAIFRSGGGHRLADQLRVPALGSIPIDADIVVGGDAGRPLLIAKPDAPATQAYLDIAQRLRAVLDGSAEQGLPSFKWRWEDGVGQPPWNEAAIDPQTTTPAIPIGFAKRDAHTLSVLWRDGRRDDFNVRDLRLVCPCAMCVDEMSGHRTLEPASVPMDVVPHTLASVGRYAISIAWTDGHSTGIYAFARLRQLGDQIHSPGGGSDEATAVAAERSAAASRTSAQGSHAHGAEAESVGADRMRATKTAADATDADLAAAVEHVLAQEVNPMVRSHGGQIALVEVKDKVAYVQMHGGCQGCGAATLTLSHGVAMRIRRAVPAIVRVVDRTDHSAGQEPFYPQSPAGSATSPFAR